MICAVHRSFRHSIENGINGSVSILYIYISTLQFQKILEMERSRRKGALSTLNLKSFPSPSLHDQPPHFLLYNSRQKDMKIPLRCVSLSAPGEMRCMYVYMYKEVLMRARPNQGLANKQTNDEMG